MKKAVLFLLFGFILSGCATSITYQCIEGDCVNGQGTYTSSNGDKYVGEWKDGKRDGQGTSTYANGDTCSGLFENNICWGTVTKDKKIELASMLDTAKTTCKELGFKEQTEKFSECALKLYSQSIELAAKNNQQVVMQSQSSGSNVMTIYDPVRDNNALMDKGMKMLSGRCTLGIDC